MQTLGNGITVPTNSDPYALTDDLAKLGKTANVIIPVANQTARDALTDKFAGMTVRRMDKGGRTEYWTGSQWLPDGAQIEIGQGANVPILKAREVAVTVDAFSVGQITFDTAFPNALASVSLVRNHATAGTVSFTVLSGAGHPTTGKTGVKFVVTGTTSVASTTVYIYYTAWGY